MRSPDEVKRYRPALDGIRALAVYLVVAYHSGIDRLAGGFIGVDVFFVLSGYLVTQVLTRDLDGGGIRLGRFYARRIRRLLPAATVVLVVTAVVVVVLNPPATWDDAESGIRAAALYVSNWFFAAQATDYFAADVTSNPVLHFWSLSVEEQFYLVWPVVLLGIHHSATALGGTARRTRRLVQGALLVGVVTSLGWAWHLADVDLSRAYYGTDTRAYQLLAGALLGLAPGALALLTRARAGRRGAAALGIASPIVLVAVASSLWAPDPIERGVLATVGALALIAAVQAAPEGPGGRILGSAPLAYLGRISYGVYLWHWIVVLVLERKADLASAPTAAITVVAATAIAALSHHLLEHPLRTATVLDRHRGPVIVGGLAVSAVVALLVVPAIFTVARDRDDGPTELDWQAAQDDEVRPPDCDADRLDDCTVVEGAGGPTILLLGDSHAAMFTPMLAGVAETEKAELVVAAEPTCPWPRGMYSAMSGEVCEEAQADWFGPILDQVDPDVVVLASRVLDDPATPTAVYGDDTGFLATGTPEFDRFVAERTEATIDDLRREGRTVVVIEPTPMQGDDVPDPIECLSAAGDVDDCAFTTDRQPGAQEQVIRGLADGEGVVALDLDRTVCPDWPTCDPVVDDLVVRRDRTHLTGTFSRHLAEPVRRLLLDAGAL